MLNWPLRLNEAVARGSVPLPAWRLVYIFAAVALLVPNTQASADFKGESSVEIDNTIQTGELVGDLLFATRAGGVVQIEFPRGSAGCSGYLALPNLLLSARHCFTDVRPANETHVNVRFGNFGAEPDTSSMQWRLRIPGGITNDRGKPLDDESAVDAVALKIDEPLCNWHLSGSPSVQPVEPGMSLRILHYPTNLPMRTNANTCRVTGIHSSHRFFHNCPTVGGSSGAPMFDEQTGSLVGIHGGKYNNDVNWATSVDGAIDIEPSLRSLRNEFVPLVSRTVQAKISLLHVLLNSAKIYQPKDQIVGLFSKGAVAHYPTLPSDPLYLQAPDKNDPLAADIRRNRRPFVSQHDMNAAEQLLSPVKCVTPRILPRLWPMSLYPSIGELTEIEGNEAFVEAFFDPKGHRLMRINVHTLFKTSGAVLTASSAPLTPPYVDEAGKQCWAYTEQLESSLRSYFGEPAFYRANVATRNARSTRDQPYEQTNLTLFQTEQNVPVSVRTALVVRTISSHWDGSCEVVISLGGIFTPRSQNTLESRTIHYEPNPQALRLRNQTGRCSCVGLSFRECAETCRPRQ